MCLHKIDSDRLISVITHTQFLSFVSSIILMKLVILTLPNYLYHLNWVYKFTFFDSI